jgi:cyanophycin synthetase
MTTAGPLTVADSRRLTGPSLLLDGPGAILEVHLDEARAERAVVAWRETVRRLLDAVGWRDAQVAVRTFAGGASLAFTAPADALYGAAELNEAAWSLATAELEGRADPSGADERELVASLQSAIAAERNPALLALREAARAHHRLFLAGEEQVSVGAGTGVQVWPDTAIPAPSTVAWDAVHDIPLVLVTGSYGKTTVVRLIAAMATEAGFTAGLTSTEGVSVAGDPIAVDDYSGPSGARLLLRRPEVELAVLETARGGMLRRGLSVDRADVAVVTNVAEDHLGEFGVHDLETLAEVKLLVARALGEGAPLVLNADDDRLRRRGLALAHPIIWFTLDPAQPAVAAHLATGGRAALANGDTLVLAEGTRRTTVANIAELPITLGGAARHNVANALAAIGAAAGLGLALDAVRGALRRFGQAGDDNLGRANLIDLGGVRLVIDYAHNPAGMGALSRMIAQLPGRRRLVLLGQAGDRSDEAIRHLARAALEVQPDRVVLKDMDRYRRGRAPGEVPALMADELVRQGVPAERVHQPGGELESVRDALAWARPGDIMLLALHQDRPQVLALLDRLRTVGWQAGDPIPAE